MNVSCYPHHKVTFWIKRHIVDVRQYLADQYGSRSPNRCSLSPSKHLFRFIDF